MKKLAAAAAIALSLSPGCRYFLPVVTEPIRIENTDDMSPAKLGFVKGETTFAQAQAMMRGKNLSGLTKTVFADLRPGARDLVLNAISADYQMAVHVFENDRYRESVRLHAGSVLPYGGALTISSSGNSIFLLALYRDPLEMTDQKLMAQPPRIEIFEQSGGSFVFRSTFHIGKIAADNGGITRPIFVGHDLDDGVMLLARDNDGVIWDGAYFLRLENGSLKTTHVSLQEASRCSCVQKYMYGEDIESLWRE